jgi:hypothetical protein
MSSTPGFENKFPSKASRKGFSLILSLTIMAAMLLMVISLSAFLTVESRLAKSAAYRAQSRLQAVVSLRLALAHLQQEAGPDRRMTARADITADSIYPPPNDNNATSPTNKASWDWSNLPNPMWTGVWRSDYPLQPPAWLISGRHDRPANSQTVNLYKVTDYTVNQWAPWQTDYNPSIGPIMVTLVGDASASGYVLANGTNPGKPDGRVKLPKVPLPDDGVAGSYAYWVGDEGIKARINFQDPRISPPTSVTGTTRSDFQMQGLRGAARPGIESIMVYPPSNPSGVTPFTNMPSSGIDSRVAYISQLANLDPTVFPETTPPTITQCLSTDCSFYSKGVLCDSFMGGLKIDLSLAFEKTDADFNNTEFVSGIPPNDSNSPPFPMNGVTFTMNPTDSGIHESGGYQDFKVTIQAAGNNYQSSPIWRHGNAPSTLVGPTWESLRSYYLLYKGSPSDAGSYGNGTVAGVTWPTPTTPTITARAVYPNTVAFSQSGYGGTAYYSHKFNRMDDGSRDYWRSDFSLDGGGSLPAMRVTRVGVFPYVARQQMVLGLVNNNGVINLTFTPITVLHNPYNIAVKVGSIANESAAMRLSYRAWSSWFFQFSKTPVAAGSATTSWQWDMQTLALASSGAAGDSSAGQANWNEEFRTYIAPITLGPGEFRVFTPNNTTPVPISRFTTSTNNYNFMGGFMLPCLNVDRTPLAASTTNTITVGLVSSGGSPIYIRHLLSSWPGDIIMGTSNSGDGVLYNACSEVTELTSNAMDAARAGSAPPKVILPGVPLASPGQPPNLLAVIDFGVRWPNDPMGYPLFVHSNPMATMTRPEATGVPPNSSALANKFATTSNSFKATIYPVNSWAEVFQPGPGGTLAYGGTSNTASGQTSAVYTEVPLSAPISLAQFTHANFTIADQDPLFAIGNSFPTPLGGVNSYWNTYSDSAAFGTSTPITWVDRTLQHNMALFDRYFFSGAVAERHQGVVARSQTQVIQDFANNVNILANPRISLFSKRDSTTTLNRLQNHRQIAGSVLNEGQFNINSTSVGAWTIMLSNAKRNAMGNATEVQPSTTANTRYPRAMRPDQVGYNYKSPFSAANAWTGLANLDDAQIQLLAKSIVDEIRWRVKDLHRTGHNFWGDSSGIDGHTLPTFKGKGVDIPFRRLSEFVNRFTCAPFECSALGGVLQVAIVRADDDGAQLSNRTTGAAPYSGSAQQMPGTGAGIGSVPFQVMYTSSDTDGQSALLNLEDPRLGKAGSPNRAHLLEGSPASLIQSDILEAIGPALASRSDTFIIRAYGDVVATPGSTQAYASSWVEAVVQRIPEFIDASQVPETEVSAPQPNIGQANNIGRLHYPNIVLGRRFQIVAVRFLAQKDL